jgi:hypothetical protein
MLGKEREEIIMERTVPLLFMAVYMMASGCNQTLPKYLCPDNRATYFDINGRVVTTDDGISEGYVLIPAVGDAGSFMIGKYVKIQNGVIVERCKGIPDIIKENTSKPYRENKDK